MTKHGVPVTEQNVRFFGRTLFRDGVWYFDMTGAGFEVRFFGTGLSARLVTDKAISLSERAFLTVFVDGEEKEHFPLKGKARWYPLASGLPEGEHTLRLIKRSEARRSAAGVTELLPEGGGLLPPVPSGRSRKIEFIGDSITCGYGNTASELAIKFFSAEEDGLATYAALAAEALEADFHTVCASGWAVRKSPYGGCLPEVYCKTDGFRFEEEWDFSRFQPDLVVINLGTNDYAWYCYYAKNADLTEKSVARLGAEKKWLEEGETDDGDALLTAFRDAYAGFLALVRQKNPDAWILCTLGLMGCELEPQIKEAIAKSRLKRVSYFRLPYLSEVGGPGGNGHPNLEAHRNAAELLAAHLRLRMGWENTSPGGRP
ncbi:MAG: GDSL-type esterase/lipase family protein [Oscillospiraceae bacterium]|nr:GDSL-type esterase/lipase family protein [Oscillospiraceae bacterium]